GGRGQTTGDRYPTGTVCQAHALTVVCRLSSATWERSDHEEQRHLDRPRVVHLTGAVGQVWGAGRGARAERGAAGLRYGGHEAGGGDALRAAARGPVNA